MSKNSPTKENYEKACRRFDEEALKIAHVLRMTAHSIEQLVEDNVYGEVHTEISDLAQWLSESLDKVERKLETVCDCEEELKKLPREVFGDDYGSRPGEGGIGDQCPGDEPQRPEE